MGPFILANLEGEKRLHYSAVESGGRYAALPSMHSRQGEGEYDDNPGYLQMKNNPLDSTRATTQ